MQRHQRQVTTFRHDRSDLFGEEPGRRGSRSSIAAAGAQSRGLRSIPGRHRTVDAANESTSTAVEAAGIQQSLERTQALLRSELERVSHVASAIDQDGKVLDETAGLHRQLNGSAVVAKRALSALERAQQRQQRVLRGSLVFFASVVLYIAWERVLTRLPFFDRILQSILRLRPF
jgi:hypothetical protein